MNETLAVRVRERLGHRARDVQRLAERKLLLAVESVPSCAHPVGRDAEQRLTLLPGVDDRYDVGMVQPRGHADLAQKTPAADRLRELQRQDLERYQARERRVLGQVDRRRRASPEPRSTSYRSANNVEGRCGPDMGRVGGDGTPT